MSIIKFWRNTTQDFCQKNSLRILSMKCHIEFIASKKKIPKEFEVTFFYTFNLSILSVYRLIVIIRTDKNWGNEIQFYTHFILVLALNLRNDSKHVNFYY